MTKNQQQKPTEQLAINGRQIAVQDGFQTTAMMEGVEQRGYAVQPTLGENQPQGYGRQTSSPQVPQSTFSPASGPKIPPMRK